jgi:uncharacterized protein (TIGR02996 family)
MTSLGKALLADVCEHPEDDTPRLVYADWLEEHGGQRERAEAIRLGVRRRRLDDLDPEAWVLDSQLRWMHETDRAAWKAELPKLDGVSFGGFRGGLVRLATVHSSAHLLRHEEALFGAVPLDYLQLFVEGPGDTAALARCRYLHRLHTLEISGMIRPTHLDLPLLAGCPGLARLRRLRIPEGAHEDGLLRALASCPAWPALESLTLYRGMFGAPGLRALASAPVLSTLRSLELSRCHMGNAGLRALLRSPHVGRLHRLDLSENNLGTRVLKDFVAVNVRQLDLSGNHDLGDADARVLARSEHLGALRVLGLGFWRLTRRGVVALAGAPWLPNLTRLDLMSLDAGRPGIEVLASAPLTGLRWLELNYSKLGPAEVKALLSAPWISQLTHLDLNNNAIETEGARALAEAPQLDNLVQLDVTRNSLSDEAGDLLRGRFGERVEVKRSWE